MSQQYPPFSPDQQPQFNQQPQFHQQPPYQPYQQQPPAPFGQQPPDGSGQFQGDAAMQPKRKKTGLIVGLMCGAVVLVAAVVGVVLFTANRAPSAQSFVREYVDHIAAGESQEALAMESPLDFEYDETSEAATVAAMDLRDSDPLSSAGERIVVDEIVELNDLSRDDPTFGLTYSLAGNTFKTQIALSQNEDGGWQIVTPLIASVQMDNVALKEVVIGEAHADVAGKDIFNFILYPGSYTFQGVSIYEDAFEFEGIKVDASVNTAQAKDAYAAQSFNSAVFEPKVTDTFRQSIVDEAQKFVDRCAADVKADQCGYMSVVAQHFGAKSAELKEGISVQDYAFNPYQAKLDVTFDPLAMLFHSDGADSPHEDELEMVGAVTFDDSGAPAYSFDFPFQF